MKNNGLKPTSPRTFLPKCPSGIQGLEEITGGGLPRGRESLTRHGLEEYVSDIPLAPGVMAAGGTDL